LTAVVLAVVVYRMPPLMAVGAFASGAAFGLLPVGWTIFNAMQLYNVTVETGQFRVVRRSGPGLVGVAGIQPLLLGVAFRPLLEPLYMVKCMGSWRKTLEVWPALAVSGGSFALFQYTFATIHSWPHCQDLLLYPMTDIGGGIFSLVVTAVFLRFWRPKQEWHFDKVMASAAKPAQAGAPHDPHALEAAALLGSGPPPSGPGQEPPLTWQSVSL